MQNGIEFFTATCLNWQPLLQTESHKQIVMDSLRFLVDDKRIWLYGYVIMDNHVHILWCKQPEWADKNVQQHFSKFTAQQLKFNIINNSANLDNYKALNPIELISFGKDGLSRLQCTTVKCLNRSWITFITILLKLVCASIRKITCILLHLTIYSIKTTT